ncbi:peroxide stress protein YaaA [Larsenimonas rhizosphaerae]|uniref:peroxide stress protein YaaA n=1 Tax=Larsenimonas rhizosphaerae TaxID=2944682 RepID=UPI002033EF5F|nr:peroxide stress protein YaaA [Larsenimonas rhizosphaerae]MCM2131595.1 peroxide stress protein YaaA [Larsenimonas rhizosphaerae]
MLSVISPAKTLDFETPPSTRLHSQPDFLSHSRELIDVLRTYSPHQLADLMKLSDKLAGLNTARNAEWHTPFTPENAKPAVLAFQGDVYQGLEAERWQEQDNEWAQQHLRILSGLYGVLRPFDLIQPYRLEMGTRLANSRGQDLYSYWRNDITTALQNAVEESGSATLVNLASNEYFKAVDKKAFGPEIITPVFKDAKNGQYKIISFYAKKARGLMSNWMIRQRLDDPEALKSFNEDGYSFNQAMSDKEQWVFTREAP